MLPVINILVPSEYISLVINIWVNYIITESYLANVICSLRYLSREQILKQYLNITRNSKPIRYNKTKNVI